EHFWIFKDLGSPDRRWTITLGSLSLPINILPIIMTLINVVSAAVYTRGGTVKEKVQIYALAAVFLVLLYNSPSGLVIYWILNNIFSLCKNVIQKMKHPAAIMCYIIGAGLILMSAVLFTLTDKGKPAEKAAVMIAGIFFTALPVLWDKLAGTTFYAALSDRAAAVMKKNKSDFFIFLFSALGLAVLLGLLLPASVISTSPTEFSFLGKTDSPFSYIHSSLWTFLGMCVFWPTVIYFMFGDKIKHVLTVIFPALLVCALCNVYVFKADYGNLNAMFMLTETAKTMTVPHYYNILSLLITLLCISVYYVCKKTKMQSIVSVLLFALCLGISSFGLYRTGFIRSEYKAYALSKDKAGTVVETNKITPIYHLSKDGQNVIVIFLDRAIGIFLPYIMEEFPQLKTEFSGWTYYPNTVSFGRYTNTGVPAMVGGYEYTPDKMNERSDELLKDKHNEACFVMPVLFQNAGYDVTVTDMPWLNYSWDGDLTVYDKYPGIKGYNILGQYLSDYSIAKKDDRSVNEQTNADAICRDKIKYFSLTQCLFPAFRNRFYSASTCDLQQANGISFLQNFSNLYFLRELTDFTNDKNTYSFITNNSTHEYAALNVPGYDTASSSETVDYGDYEPGYKSADNDVNQAYQVNTAAILQIAKWLEYLKDNDIYDNTRIIITADHGRDITMNDLYPAFAGSGISADNPAANNPLLMVKDFNADGELKTDNSFMTNADTIFFAIKDLPVSDINPFTSNQLTQEKENGVVIHCDSDWNAAVQKHRTAFTYNPKEGFIIRDNIFNPKNWTKITGNE
ncbi:MAG: YidC/Oxa1 family membrane protein insertase, partial [Spirochaetales bacterium]|nr:YidC/Oxa1 family membrane protein insertase [Spirochaetales bacterium]